jgi:hypothetical protein
MGRERAHSARGAYVERCEERDDVLRRDPPRVERLAPPREERRDELRLGTFAPFSRASERPIAIACFRLVTRPPCPDFPLFNVPDFRRLMALSTDLDAALP